MLSATFFFSPSHNVQIAFMFDKKCFLYSGLECIYFNQIQNEGRLTSQHKNLIDNGNQYNIPVSFWWLFKNSHEIKSENQINDADKLWSIEDMFKMNVFSGEKCNMFLNTQQKLLL